MTDNGAWLAYGTPQQVVGLVAWPLDGIPEHSMGVIAHPGDIKAMALSFDGRKLITLGEPPHHTLLTANSVVYEISKPAAPASVCLGSPA